MDEKFALQVTPELMLKLARDEDGPTKKKGVRGKPAQSTRKALKDERKVESPVAGWPSSAAFPGYISSLPGPAVRQQPQPLTKHSQEFEKELASIRKMLDETEKLAESLQRDEKLELEKVKAMARELQDKQYRAPSKSVPCSEEREACLKCYQKNMEDPLLCAKNVQAFVQCSRRAQQAFVAATH